MTLPLIILAAITAVPLAILILGWPRKPSPYFHECVEEEEL